MVANNTISNGIISVYKLSVTIIGGSAGAASVTYLMNSPLAKGIKDHLHFFTKIFPVV